MDKLDAPAHTHKEAAHWSEPRPRPMPPVWIILHDTEGGTAESIANYFASPASKGSTQLVSDDSQTIRTLPDNVIPWGAIGANTRGLHIEMCGFAKWSSGDWHHHEALLHRAAYQVAQWCKKYDIPPVHIGVTGLRKGQKGIATHRDVTYAFHLDTHTNPGLGFPLDYFISLVRSYVMPPPEPDHFHIEWTKDDGTPDDKWTDASGLDKFARAAQDNHPDTLFKYAVTIDPKGEPQ